MKSWSEKILVLCFLVLILLISACGVRLKPVPEKAKKIIVYVPDTITVNNSNFPCVNSFPKLLMKSLMNAGYRVINDPSKDHHLEAKLSATVDDVDVKNSSMYITADIMFINNGNIISKSDDRDIFSTSCYNLFYTTEDLINDFVNELSGSLQFKEFLKNPVFNMPHSINVGNKIAVMDFTDETNKFSQDEIKAAADYVRSKLIDTGKFTVIPRERQERFMVQEMKKESYKQCYDESCQIPLGQALSADTIITGKISKLFNRFTITLEFIDLAKEATVKGASENFNTPEELLDALDKIINRTILNNLTDEQQ